MYTRELKKTLQTSSYHDSVSTKNGLPVTTFQKMIANPCFHNLLDSNHPSHWITQWPFFKNSSQCWLFVRLCPLWTLPPLWSFLTCDPSSDPHSSCEPFPDHFPTFDSSPGRFALLTLFRTLVNPCVIFLDLDGSVYGKTILTTYTDGEQHKLYHLKKSLWPVCSASLQSSVIPVTFKLSEHFVLRGNLYRFTGHTVAESTPRTSCLKEAAYL